VRRGAGLGEESEVGEGEEGVKIEWWSVENFVN
jgi:hypothetical protein